MTEIGWILALIVTAAMGALGVWMAYRAGCAAARSEREERGHTAPEDGETAGGSRMAAAAPAEARGVPGREQEMPCADRMGPDSGTASGTLYESDTVEEQQVFAEEQSRAIERQMQLYDQVFAYTRFALMAAGELGLGDRQAEQLTDRLLRQLLGEEEDYRTARGYLTAMLMARP